MTAEFPQLRFLRQHGEAMTGFRHPCRSPLHGAEFPHHRPAARAQFNGQGSGQKFSFNPVSAGCVTQRMGYSSPAKMAPGSALCPQRPPDELRERIYRRMERQGTTMAGQVLWSQQEIQVLYALAPRYDLIGEQIKGRTFEAIRHKCNSLGLSKTVHIWTAAEISKLRRLFPAAPRGEIIEAFPFLTWSQIKSAARRHRFRRARPAFKKSDDPLMNAILMRCAAIGWSLADLDAECGSRRYFRRRDWRKYTPNAKAVLKAIEVLGGTVSVKWRE